MALVHEQFIRACDAVNVRPSTHGLLGGRLCSGNCRRLEHLVAHQHLALESQQGTALGLTCGHRRKLRLPERDVDLEQHQNPANNQCMPVLVSDLAPMLHYGKSRYRAAIFLRKH